ncbi:MAG: glycosyl hydrolase family 28 protein, partial [Terriglobales bacterium]
MLRACAILNARYTRAQIAEANSDSGPDTQRVQDALDLCDPGQIVVLRSDKSKDAFLSAPLVLPRGVKLFIDKGVTLYASRNPRDYDLNPVSCGSAGNDGVPRCKPFLFAYQAAYSGVVGYGTIDGQGGEPLAGSRRSWWDLLRRGERVSVPDLVSSYESQGFMLSGVTLRSAAGYPASIFKTIGFIAAGLKIESPEDSASIAGLLLSNSPGAEIGNIWIHVPSTAISIQGSILGSTSHVSIHDAHLFGG